MIPHYDPYGIFTRVFSDPDIFLQSRGACFVRRNRSFLTVRFEVGLLVYIPIFIEVLPPFQLSIKAHYCGVDNILWENWEITKDRISFQILS